MLHMYNDMYFILSTSRLPSISNAVIANTLAEIFLIHKQSINERVGCYFAYRKVF